jgi:GNAT superfamily N-acetyltransferase
VATIPSEVTFDGYRPGALAAVLALHMDYYGPLWGFGRPFESKVAAEMGAFLARLDPAHDLFLTAWSDGGDLLGAITIDGIDADTAGAHLRWFVVGGRTRGRGLGRELMRRADAFCRERGYGRIYLTTFAGLDAARALYERFGFRLVEETVGDPWSGTVGLQRVERR